MSDLFCISAPRNGDILNRHDGTETADQLLITVGGSCPAGAQVEVNGIPAAVAAAQFTCEVPVTSRRTKLQATCRYSGGQLSDEVLVLWDQASFKRYRFSVDDNIQFVKDLGLHPQDYSSLFDHWYLDFWRRMHLEYGTKVHLNLYYQTDAFDLTGMPDKWKQEWQENGSWLRLAFHALADKPDRPYRNAVYTQMAHDFDLIMGHIRRFAGNEVISCADTVHWAECSRPAIGALKDRGIDVLVGLFSESENKYCTGYYHDEDTCKYVANRDYFYDPDTDLTFICCDSVVNTLAVDEVVPMLEQQAASGHTGELIELLIHEQYFRRDIPELYQSDVQQKVIAALEWVTEHGYEPVFWGDGFCGNTPA